MFTAVAARRLRPAARRARRPPPRSPPRSKPIADATARLLDACAALGLLRKQDGVYANEPVAELYLCAVESAHAARLHPLLRRGALPDVGPSGRRGPRRHATAGRRRSASHGPIFSALLPHRRGDARLHARHARLRHADLAGRGRRRSTWAASARSSDLGGATGHLAIAACERYPELRGVVFDLPAVTPLPGSMVAASPARDRIEVVAGDFFADELPRGRPLRARPHPARLDGGEDRAAARPDLRRACRPAAVC